MNHALLMYSQGRKLQTNAATVLLDKQLGASQIQPEMGDNATRVVEYCSVSGYIVVVPVGCHSSCQHMQPYTASFLHSRMGHGAIAGKRGHIQLSSQTTQ